MREQIDKTDRRLLTLLQRDNQRTLRDLAAAAYVSPPTCLRRIRRLQTQGVIRANVSLLDPAKLGLGVHAFVEVSLTRPSGSEMKAFERRMKNCPEVTQCSEVSGEVDYLLTLRVRDMQSFSEFTRKHFADDARVKSYRSMIVMRQTKNEHEVAV